MYINELMTATSTHYLMLNLHWKAPGLHYAVLALCILALQRQKHKCYNIISIGRVKMFAFLLTQAKIMCRQICSCPVMLVTRKSHYFFFKINEFVVNLLVIEVSTLNLAHIIRMRKYVFSEILVAMVTIFLTFTMFLSYKIGNAYKVQKFHDLAIHTVTCNTSNERGRLRDE